MPLYNVTYQGKKYRIDAKTSKTNEELKQSIMGNINRGIAKGIADEGLSKQERVTRFVKEKEKLEPEKEDKRTWKEYVLPSWATKYEEKPGERTLLGDIWERPAAAIRSGLRSQKRGEGFAKGYLEGAIRPEEVATFQERAIDNYYSARDPRRITTQIGGLGVSAVGLVGDIVTNPADLLTMIIPSLRGTRRVIGKGVAKLDKTGRVIRGRPVGDVFTDVINVPKSVMASTDLSAPARQGWFFVGRKEFYKGLPRQVKYAFSKKSFDKTMIQITKRKTYPLMKKGKLALTEMGKLAKREEAFMSTYAEKIPAFGQVIKASDRAYTGFLNKLRADVFDDILRSYQKVGGKVDDNFISSLGRYINSATGRGDLSKLGKAAVHLNSVFFSPRLMKSRFDLLNPMYYYKLHPFVRKEAIKDLFKMSAVRFSITSLAKAGGATVEGDPRSSDFGKIRAGNVRYDVSGGFDSYLRYFAQLASGTRKSTLTGIKKTKGPFGESLRPQFIGGFLRSKESPAFSLAHDLLTGKDFLGEKVTFSKAVKDRFTPLFIQDLLEVMKEHEDEKVKGFFKGLPGAIGFGVNAYSPNPEQYVNSVKSIKREITILKRQGRIAEARTLISNNEENLRRGAILKPYQDRMNKIEKAITYVKEDTRIKKKEKEKRLNFLLKKFDDLQHLADDKLREMNQQNKK